MLLAIAIVVGTSGPSHGRHIRSTTLRGWASPPPRMRAAAHPRFCADAHLRRS
jgi:hypothetical protein